MANVGLKDLLEAGVHFGHQTRKWNPKMKPYIFIARGGIYIIDLQRTLRNLNRASKFLETVGAKGGSRLGWVLLDGDAKGLLVEAWPLGNEDPFPVPAYEPGGKPVNDRPDAPKRDGSMTPEYLERLLERLKKRRPKDEAR